jgi:predicted metal-dependent HD superfamily phosphohydrolase
MLGDETVDSVDISETTFEYFQDMDLAILGSPPDQYAQYVKLLQKEHELIGLSVYRNMRLKVSAFVVWHNRNTMSFLSRFYKHF